MNTNDIREYLLAHSPWVDPKHTWDTVKVGDPEREIHTVGVGWLGSTANLRAAHEAGCELFITHEALFWENAAFEHVHRFTQPGIAKQQYLEQSGMVVLRAHDTWDRWPEIGIRDSWASWLGLRRVITKPDMYRGIYEIEETPLEEFARQVASRVRALGYDSVGVLGDLRMQVSRPAIGTGCAVPTAEYARMGSDVLLVVEQAAPPETVQDRLVDMGVGVIVVPHGASEMPGLAVLARHLGEVFPELEAQYFGGHPKPVTILGE